MKILALLVVTALMELISVAPLPAQSPPIVRGEKISAVPPAARDTNLAKTNLPSGATAETNQPAAIKDGDYVGFGKLAGFILPLSRDLEYATNAPEADARINEMIPAAIRAADGKMIRINGYMTPLDYDGGKTRQFILSLDPSSCCYGDMPQVHEMIQVRMKTDGVPVHGYVPVQVRGVLRVGAKRDGPMLASIYRMEAESVHEVAE